MMGKFRFWTILLATALIFGFAGCDGGTGVDEDIDYTNYQSGFSVRVKNDTDKKLVAFKGTPDSGTLISGIPVGGGTHGLKRDASLFNTSHDFMLFLVTEEDYLACKGNWTALRDRPFTKIYAYYNTNAENANVYTISSLLGGNRQIIVQNNTPYNVELRNKGPHGEIIGYVGDENYDTTFLVKPDNYMIFPVFRKYSEVLKEIITGYPVYGPGDLEGTSIFDQFSLDDKTVKYDIDIKKLTSGFKMTAGAAFLKIVNNMDTGVGFWDGGERQTTESGGETINRNNSMMFPILMTRTGQNKFSPYEVKAQFQIGTDAFKKTVDSYTYWEGIIYQIEITGNPNNMVFSEIEGIDYWDFK